MVYFKFELESLLLYSPVSHMLGLSLSSYIFLIKLSTCTCGPKAMQCRYSFPYPNEHCSIHALLMLQFDGKVTFKNFCCEASCWSNIHIIHSYLHICPKRVLKLFPLYIINTSKYLLDFLYFIIILPKYCPAIQVPFSYVFLRSQILSNSTK